MSTNASDPLFDEPTIFVMEPADLHLPQSPDSNDQWFCNSKRQRVAEDLRTGINPNDPVSEENLPRTLTRYVKPYLDNLLEVATALRNRAIQAENNFLKSQIDLEYDYIKLQQVVLEIKRYYADVVQYRKLAVDAGGLDDYNQAIYVNNHVVSPVFEGNGYASIGDEDSEWQTFIPLYCDHLILGKALNEAVNYHVSKWQDMGYEDTTAEGGPKRGDQRSVSGQALGLLGLVAVGAWLFRK